MKILTENIKKKLSGLSPILPYGVTESWEDLDPRLYHAVHIYWLKFYGMWYNDFSPKHILFWIQILFTLVSLWLVCFMPGIGEVVYLLKRRENIGDIAEGLYLFLSEMYTYFKISVFWMNRQKIKKLIAYLYCNEFKPKEAEHRDIVRKSIERARNVMTYYSTMCVGAVSGFAYIFGVPLKYANVTVGIIMPLTENFEILPTNVEYPFFDVYKSPAYETIYIHHKQTFLNEFESGLVSPPIHFDPLEYDPYEDCASKIYYKPATCIIDGVMDTLLAAFVASAIGQIEILAFNMRNFTMVAERRRRRAITENKCDGNTTTDYYTRAVLKDCIVHHNSIIKYVSMIESAFSLASALQFMLSVMVLCLIGIQFLSIEEPMSHPMQMMWMAIYLTCMLIEVFILCWFGDELIWKLYNFVLNMEYGAYSTKLHYVFLEKLHMPLKSIELRQAAFEGPWLTNNPKTNMYIIVFLERCKRPLRVTAGKIFTLSLDTYTILINWSYKAFTVMRNMKK